MHSQFNTEFINSIQGFLIQHKEEISIILVIILGLLPIFLMKYFVIAEFIQRIQVYYRRNNIIRQALIRFCPSMQNHWRELPSPKKQTITNCSGFRFLDFLLSNFWNKQPPSAPTTTPNKAPCLTTNFSNCLIMSRNSNLFLVIFDGDSQDFMQN